MEALLQEIKKNWQTFSAAPWAFYSFAIAAFGLAYMACNWFFKKQLDDLKQDIVRLKERLAEKDQLLDEYKKRINIVPGDGNKLSPLLNKDLKDQALRFVSSLREFI
jgi:cell division protein FtsL